MAWVRQYLSKNFKQTKKNETVNTLASLLNKILQGLVAVNCKAENVTQIFKKSNTNMPGNYRSINLTSVVGKMFESIIRDNIVSYLE